MDFGNELWQFAGIGVTAVALIWIVRWRHRGHAKFINDMADEHLCEHLKPVLDKLRSQGHAVAAAGEEYPGAPYQVKLSPPFDPAVAYRESPPQKPVALSERGAVICREHGCEILNY